MHDLRVYLIHMSSRSRVKCQYCMSYFRHDLWTFDWWFVWYWWLIWRKIIWLYHVFILVIYELLKLHYLTLLFVVLWFCSSTMIVCYTWVEDSADGGVVKQYVCWWLSRESNCCLGIYFCIYRFYLMKRYLSFWSLS